MNDIDNIIADLEKRRAGIDQAIAALKGISGQETATKKRRGRPKASKTKKRTISSEGRERQKEAMRRYWAAKKAAAPKQSGSKKRAAKEAEAGSGE